MFDDVFSSSRGPGVIGTFLAVFVLAGFCGLGVTVFNSDDIGPSADSLVAEQAEHIVELNEKIADKTAQLTQYRSYQEMISDISLQKKLLKMRTERVADLSEKRTSAETRVVDAGKTFEDYKALYRKNERERARGEIVDLSETKGEKFKSAKILRINPIEMRVGLSSGPKGVKYEELPRHLQERFQFDVEEANAYREALGMVQKRREEDLSKWGKEQQIKKAAARASQQAQDIAQMSRLIASKKASIKRKRSLAQKWESKADEYTRKANYARVRGNMSMDRGNARKAENTAKRLHRAARAGDQEIQKLQRKIAELKRKFK